MLISAKSCTCVAVMRDSGLVASVTDIVNLLFNTMNFVPAAELCLFVPRGDI